MSNASGSSVHHSVRFYVVLITLVLGVIFVVLLYNNNGKGLSFLTSAVTEEPGEFTTTVGNGSENVVVDSSNQYYAQGVVEATEQAAQSGRRFAVGLGFNQVPIIRKDSKVSLLLVRFSNPTSETIMINGDKLELQDITSDVTLTIKDFEGSIDFSSPSINVQGKAKRLSVNNIALSSERELSLAFDVDYNYVSIEQLDIEVVELAKGKGKLTIGDKLEYGLEEERLDLYGYTGSVVVDEMQETLLTLDGTAKGVSVSGDFLNVDLR